MQTAPEQLERICPVDLKSLQYPAVSEQSQTNRGTKYGLQWQCEAGHRKSALFPDIVANRLPLQEQQLHKRLHLSVWKKDNAEIIFPVAVWAVLLRNRGTSPFYWEIKRLGCDTAATVARAFRCGSVRHPDRWWPKWQRLAPARFVQFQQKNRHAPACPARWWSFPAGAGWLAWKRW